MDKLNPSLEKKNIMEIKRRCLQDMMGSAGSGCHVRIAQQTDRRRTNLRPVLFPKTRIMGI